MTRIAVRANEPAATAGMIVWVDGAPVYGYGRELDRGPADGLGRHGRRRASPTGCSSPARRGRCSCRTRRRRQGPPRVARPQPRHALQRPPERPAPAAGRLGALRADLPRSPATSTSAASRSRSTASASATTRGASATGPGSTSGTGSPGSSRDGRGVQPVRGARARRHHDASTASSTAPTATTTSSPRRRELDRSDDGGAEHYRVVLQLADGTALEVAGERGGFSIPVHPAPTTSPSPCTRRPMRLTAADGTEGYGIYEHLVTEPRLTHRARGASPTGPAGARSAGWLTADGRQRDRRRPRRRPTGSRRSRSCCRRWRVLVAVEEGTVDLDEPAGPPGLHRPPPALPRVRPARSRASGRSPSRAGAASTATPPSRCSARSSRSGPGLPFGDYVRRGRAARRSRWRARPGAARPPTAPAARSPTCCASCGELLHPGRVLAPATLAEATTVQLPELRGVLPGFGRSDPNPWGLGFEIRGDKSPHWMPPDRVAADLRPLRPVRLVPLGRPRRGGRLLRAGRGALRRLGPRGLARPRRQPFWRRSADA